jgi:hypothetical protein
LFRNIVKKSETWFTTPGYLVQICISPLGRFEEPNGVGDRFVIPRFVDGPQIEAAEKLPTRGVVTCSCAICCAKTTTSRSEELARNVNAEGEHDGRSTGLDRETNSPLREFDEQFRLLVATVRDYWRTCHKRAPDKCRIPRWWAESRRLSANTSPDLLRAAYASGIEDDAAMANASFEGPGHGVAGRLAFTPATSSATRSLTTGPSRWIWT